MRNVLFYVLRFFIRVVVQCYSIFYRLLPKDPSLYEPLLDQVKNLDDAAKKFELFIHSHQTQGSEISVTELMNATQRSKRESDVLFNVTYFRLKKSVLPPYPKKDIHDVARIVRLITHELEDLCQALFTHKIEKANSTLQHLGGLITDAIHNLTGMVELLPPQKLNSTRINEYWREVDLCEKKSDAKLLEAQVEHLQSLNTVQEIARTLTWLEIYASAEELLDHCERLALSIKRMLNID